MSKTRMLLDFRPECLRTSCFPVFLGVLLMVIGGIALSPAVAAKPFKVGIVDPQAVIQGSKAGKRAIAQLQEHANVRKKLLEGDQKSIKQLEAILKKANDLTEEERTKKQDYYQKTYQEYQQKVQELQKRGQEFEQELVKKQQEMVLEYMEKIQVATKAVAEKHGFSMVVDKGSKSTLNIVLYSQKGLDITSEVVKEFDRRFK